MEALSCSKQAILASFSFSFAVDFLNLPRAFYIDVSLQFKIGGQKCTWIDSGCTHRPKFEK
jgi:hypothetical protein